MLVPELSVDYRRLIAAAVAIGLGLVRASSYGKYSVNLSILLDLSIVALLSFGVSLGWLITANSPNELALTVNAVILRLFSV
mgnify:CR=1 FL=1